MRCVAARAGVVVSLAFLGVLVAPSPLMGQSFLPIPPVPLGIGVAPNKVTAVASGDFDNDGIKDLAGVDNANNGSIGAALGLGGGLYGGAMVSGPTTTMKASHLRVGDFDPDGNLDLAFSGLDALNQPAIYVARGNGTGTFASPTVANVVGAAGFVVTGLTVTDFDGDGLLDIQASTSAPLTGVVILINAGGSTFGPMTSSGTMAGARDIDVCVDFNHDGFKDLVIVTSNSDGTQAAVVVYPGQAGPPFISALTAIVLHLPNNSSPVDCHWIDCNQDQFYDIAVALDGMPTGVLLIQNLGMSPFFSAGIAPPFLVGPSPNSLLRLEANFDGVEDLTLLDIGIPATPSSRLDVLLVSNTCNIAPGSMVSVGQFDRSAIDPLEASAHGVDDLDDDGRLDVFSVDHGPVLATPVRPFLNTQPVTLVVRPPRVALGQNTAIQYGVSVPTMFANRRFAILFSVAGTQPGLPVSPTLHLPLNDPLPFIVPGMLSGPPVVTGTVTFGPIAFPPNPTLFSAQVSAAAVVEGATPGTIKFVTNPAVITIP